jgi:DNA-binding MarR family transcriptional regulator
MVQSVLARTLGMPESTLSDAIERLVHLGYVEQSPDPFDRRYIFVALTRIVGEHTSTMALQALQEIAVRVDSALTANQLERLMNGNRLKDRYRGRRPSKRPAGRSRLDGVL